MSQTCCKSPCQHPHPTRHGRPGWEHGSTSLWCIAVVVYEHEEVTCWWRRRTKQIMEKKVTDGGVDFLWLQSGPAGALGQSKVLSRALVFRASASVSTFFLPLALVSSTLFHTCFGQYTILRRLLLGGLTLLRPATP